MDVMYAEQPPEVSLMISHTLEIEGLDGNSEEMVKIYENENMIFYFRDSRDVLMVYDKRNSYTWKSGLDIPFSREVKDGLREGFPIGYEPIEDRMNIIYTGFANSLITIEYYDPSLQIRRLASAAFEGVNSQLSRVIGNESHFVLDVFYDEIDLSLRVHLHLNDEGYEIKLLFSEITGTAKQQLAAVILNPFLGASGGKHYLFNEDTGEHSDLQNKGIIDGYVLVPDGSGALIHFRDNATEMKLYNALIYGHNLAKGTLHETIKSNVYREFNTPTMPVFGIAHSTHQAAFIGYAIEGDAYMELVVMPEENTTYYTFAYPRFVYNTSYFQVFNQAGDSYLKLMDEINSFDVRFVYEFLAGAGDTGFQADYTGMALAYQSHLLETGVLTRKKATDNEIPIRLDFIMSDLKNAVLGHEHVIVTNSAQVKYILETLRQLGVNAKNVGLHGWQNYGMTSSRPWRTDWHQSIGSRTAFKELIDYGRALDVDISFVQDYVNFHAAQISPTGNAIKHLNSWFLTRNILDDAPFTTFYFATPQRAIAWMYTQIGHLTELGILSHSIEGISNILFSNHGDNPLTEKEVILLYQEALRYHNENLMLNLDNPNMYLWAYTDRFLQTPMFHTMHLIQTESVPFLQMVLNGTMELYAIYSNFSFFNQKDLLRLIDYNTFPSFVLTYEPAHYLSTTNALNFYSTGYQQFTDLIVDFYSQINEALSQVAGALWIDRQILRDGIVKNSYDNGVDIYINFNDKVYEIEDITLAPLSFEVIRREGN